MHPNTQTKIRSTLATLLVPTLLLGIASGCGAGDPGTENEEATTLGVAVQPLVVPNPAEPYFAEVTANGTGCPAGTWTTTISDDGKTFTTIFSAYETFLEPGQTITIKDCQLGITLRSPQGLSFAVDSFYYQGYAFLDAGLTGRQTANYYFMGNPLNHAELRTDLRGPYDDSYLFQDAVGIADLVWSPCGVNRNLNVTTRLRVQNNPRRTGTGYMNLTSIDATSRLVFRLAWRSC
jgi:hypothetical protein